MIVQALESEARPSAGTIRGEPDGVVDVMMNMKTRPRERFMAQRKSMCSGPEIGMFRETF